MQLNIVDASGIFNHMIEYQPLLDHVFHALSDPTRRAMLGALAGLLLQLEPWPAQLWSWSGTSAALHGVAAVCLAAPGVLLVRQAVVARQVQAAPQSVAVPGESKLELTYSTRPEPPAWWAEAIIPDEEPPPPTHHL